MSNLTLKIEIDQHCDVEVFDIENLMFISNHRDYDSVNNDYNIDDFESMEDLVKRYEKNNKVFPVNAYIHSGIMLSLGTEYPFDCQWDSGLFGFLIVPKELDWSQENTESFVKNWSMAWNGEVYYYVIENREGEHIDSCSGFIGYGYCEEEGNSQLKWIENDLKKKRQAHLKRMILSKVPLIYRSIA